MWLWVIACLGAGRRIASLAVPECSHQFVFAEEIISGFHVVSITTATPRHPFIDACWAMIRTEVALFCSRSNLPASIFLHMSLEITMSTISHDLCFTFPFFAEAHHHP